MASLTVLPYDIEQQFVSANVNDLKKLQIAQGAYFHINKVDEFSRTIDV